MHLLFRDCSRNNYTAIIAKINEINEDTTKEIKTDYIDSCLCPKILFENQESIVLDFLKDNVMKDMSEKKQVRTMQVLVVFFIVLSVVIAMDPPTFIAQLMGISWGALAGAFLAPFMYGLYWKGVTRAAVWASFASGVGITVLNLFFHFIASPINAGAVAMVAGLIVVPVVSVLTPKLKKERVDEIFACYDEKVTITKKRSLEQN